MPEDQRIELAEKKIAHLITNEGKMIKLLEGLSIKTMSLDRRVRRIESIIVRASKQE